MGGGPFGLDFHSHISRFWLASCLHICQQSLPKKNKIPRFPSNSCLEQAAAEKLKQETIKGADDLCHIYLMSPRQHVVRNRESKHLHISWIKLCVLNVSRALESARLPCVIHRPGGSYLWPSSAFISSSVDNGGNSPLSSLSIRGAGVFLGPLRKLNKTFSACLQIKPLFFCAWPQRICLGKRPW